MTDTKAYTIAVVLDDLEKRVDAATKDVLMEASSGALDRDDRVSIGQRLHAIQEESKIALDVLKGSLREDAVKELGGNPGSCRFDAPDGSRCTVSVPKPAVAVKKDADVTALKALLGPSFQDFFEEVVTYKPHKDFKVRTASCDPAKSKELLEAVAVVEGTPKVTFKE